MDFVGVKGHIGGVKAIIERLCARPIPDVSDFFG